MNLTISENTKAILLLTAPLLAGKTTASNDLLTPGEYKKLARHLRERERQPSDLLAQNGSGIVQECRTVVDEGRLERLLGRGFLLSQAIERWHARAIWIVSRADQNYPGRLKSRLKEDAPAVIYGCGKLDLLETGGLAVVGSRQVDDSLIEYTLAVGRLAAAAGHTIVSGGARGIDQAAMRGAVEEGGTVIGVLADSLEKNALNREHRDLLVGDRLVLVSPYDPNAGFNVGNAMQRNKLIYALADAALVVNADLGKGGTWSGAVEQLDKFRHIPVFVRSTGEASAALEALRTKQAILWPNPTSAVELRAVLDGALKPAAPLQDDLMSVSTNTGQNLPSVETSFSASNSGEGMTSLDAAVVLFSAVSELMLKLLETPMKEAEIARALDVSSAQAKAWLKRLIEEGKVEKLNRPVRYRSRQQPSLLS